MSRARGLNELDLSGMQRVFGTTNQSRISKRQLIQANTSHMQFIDYMMVELYIANSKHHLFDDFTEQQHAKMAEEIENRARAVEIAKAREARVDANEPDDNPQHSPECTKEKCAEDCPIAAEGEKQLPEMQDASNAGKVETVDASRLINLCDTCTASFPNCAANAEDVEYGDGPGNDNIIMCKEHKKKGVKNAE